MRKFVACIFIFIALTFLSSCTSVPKVNNQLPLTKTSTTTTTTITNPITYPTLNSTATSISPSTQFIPTTTSTINKLPQYTAEIIITPQGQNDVLFTNNMDDYYEFTCDVRLHAADGSFLSQATILSGFIPPHSHRVAELPASFEDGIPRTMSPSDVTKGLTTNNLQIYPIAASGQHIFATVALKDIALTTTQLNGKEVPSLTGKLYNEGQYFTQEYSAIQVLKNTPNGSLTLIGEGEAMLPPQGEFINISIPLWDTVSIRDSANGLIDGEITIVIQN